MIENPKIGQEVWFKEAWSGFVYSAEITAFGETEVSTRNPKKYQYAELTWDGGNGSCLLKDLYTSRKELIYALKKESENKINKIKLNIHDINDLVKFMYNHCIAPAEEYTDWDARKAVKEIAKEMLGLELE